MICSSEGESKQEKIKYRFNDLYSEVKYSIENGFKLLEDIKKEDKDILIDILATQKGVLKSIEKLSKKYQGLNKKDLKQIDDKADNFVKSLFGKIDSDDEE